MSSLNFEGLHELVHQFYYEAMHFFLKTIRMIQSFLVYLECREINFRENFCIKFLFMRRNKNLRPLFSQIQRENDITSFVLANYPILSDSSQEKEFSLHDFNIEIDKKIFLAKKQKSHFKQKFFEFFFVNFFNFFFLNKNKSGGNESSHRIMMRIPQYNSSNKQAKNYKFEAQIISLHSFLKGEFFFT